MRLDVQREVRGSAPPTYAVAARLPVSRPERADKAYHGRDDFELDLDEDDEEGETIPIAHLLGGRTFEFESAHDAIGFEALLVDACSDFAVRVQEAVDFGGSDEYELPLEDDEEDDDEDE
jgi:hypothetical protein